MTRLGGYRWSAYVIGRRVGQDLVDDADPVEADDDRQTARDGRRLVVADLLQPAHVPVNVDAAHAKRVEVLIGAPGQVDLEVGPGVQAGLASVAPR